MTTHPSVVLSLGFALVAACASAHPDFEQEFFSTDRATHDAWYQLLGTRYGCDTLAVRNAGRTFTGSRIVGSSVCTAAAFVTPQRVSAWRDSTGVREEWEFERATARAGTTSILGRSRRTVSEGPCQLRLAGSAPAALEVTELHC